MRGESAVVAIAELDRRTVRRRHALCHGAAALAGGPRPAKALELAGLGVSVTSFGADPKGAGDQSAIFQEAIDKDVPAPVITLSLLTRFRSRQDDTYGGKVLAALRNEFGGHAVKTE